VDLPAPPDDVLAQPTRARLFRTLGELRRPAGTEELAALLDLHPNGVRVHLERLREAGLVARERSRQQRGRPRDMWAISADAYPSGERPNAYHDLGRWLALLIVPGKTTLRRVEAAGRDIGRELAPRDGTGSAEENMHATLASLGFQPERDVGRSGKLTYRLRNCPYRDAVRENQPVVCTLHRGMTHGLLDVIAPATELSDFVPRDPYQAGCLIELRGELADTARESNAPAVAVERNE
jgi:predicted ArsR family transcriptional regulator